MTVKKTSEPVWISSTNNLSSIVDKLVNHKKIAVDTESNSLHAFQEQVCLIQISIPGSDFLIDPLAIKDISPLKDIFYDENIEKIFHAAEYDLLCLKRDFDFSVNNIFDTMQAARILGYRAVGLNHLLLEKYKINVDKRYQKADWAKRPLPPEQLNYARMDTHYLIDLRDELYSELVRRNLWELAKEEFQRISICGENHSEPSVPAWQRVNGANKLTPHQIPVLKALLEWRITQAERMNRPVFKIVSNKLLMTLTESTPKRLTDLTSAGLSNRQVQMFGESIIAAIKKGEQAEPIRKSRQSKPDQAFLQRLDNLREWRKKTGIKLGFESDVILPRTFMESIAKQNPKDMKALTDLMPDSPWRLNQYGEDILNSLKDL